MKEIKEVPEQLVENFDPAHKPDDSEDSGDELGVKNISPRLKESINKDFALIEEETGLPVKSYDERMKSVKLEDVKELPENPEIGDNRGAEQVFNELNKEFQEKEDKLWEVSEGYQNERIEKDVKGENEKELEEKKGNDEEAIKPIEEPQNKEEEVPQNKEEEVLPKKEEEIGQNKEEEEVVRNKEEEPIKEENVIIEENKISEENTTKEQQKQVEEEEKEPTAREEDKNEKSNEDQIFAELIKNEENQQRIIPEQKPQEELVKQEIQHIERTKQEVPVTHHEKKHVEFDNPLEKELVKREPKNEVDRTSTAVGNDIKKNDPFVGDKTKTFGEHYERTGFPAYPQNEKIKRDKNCFFCC